jgi:cytochrome c biogenesis protein CcmG/thiol:disulfide interchange protein DsbE
MKRALWLALVCGCATGGAPRPSAQMVGAPLPPLTVDGLSTGAIDLGALHGKVVLLDLWASWCAPCRDELPALDGMVERLKPLGVEIVAVSIDADKASAEAFLATRPHWSLTFGHDPTGRIPELLQPEKMPTSYVVDAGGTVRAINGGFEPGDAARIEARLRELAQRR